MKHAPTLLVSLTFALLPALSQAHFVWAYADAATHTFAIEVAESPGDGVAPILGKLAGSIQSTGLGKFAESADHRQLVAPMSKGTAAVSLVYGPHGEDLVTWWAKSSTSLSGAGASLGQEYEMTLSRSGKGLVAKVVHFGKPVSGATVEVYGKGVDSTMKLATGKDGTVALPMVASGRLSVGAIILRPGAGEHKGKAYKQKMDLVSLTVQIGAKS